MFKKNFQAVFNESALAILNQGRGAYVVLNQKNQDIKCMYRAPDGTKCGIGHLIADEDYDERFECNNVRGLVDGTHVVAERYGSDDDGWTNVPMAQTLKARLVTAKSPKQDHQTAFGFLTRLQTAHDEASKDTEFKGANFIPSYIESLKGIAYTYGLSFAAVKAWIKERADA